jgi:hypothetical protein
LVLLLPIELDLIVRIDSWQARKDHGHHLGAGRGSTPARHRAWVAPGRLRRRRLAGAPGRMRPPRPG